LQPFLYAFRLDPLEALPIHAWCAFVGLHQWVGMPQPTDPTKPCISFKTVGRKIRVDAGVKGRWHDDRHTLITVLAESGGASDHAIMDIAGHV
jgi:hypothetical protein